MGDRNALSLDEARGLVRSLQKCRGIADVHAVLNESPNWCQYSCEEADLLTLMEMSRSIEYSSVIENVARMISGSGVTLVGDEEIPDDVQETFRNNVMEFIPEALNVMTVLGFVPISWHLDPQTMKPIFEVADIETSHFHIFRNKLTKAFVLLRWDTELNVYDAMTDFYYVARPSPMGRIKSLAAKLVDDYHVLCDLKREMMREIGRPAQYIIQKRTPKVSVQEQDATDEILFDTEQQLSGQKRDREALETTSITMNGERVDFFVVQEDFELVGGAGLEQTGQYSRKPWAEQYNEARRNFSRRLYELMGVPADITEERRRDTGLARQAADQDFNRAAGRWARRMGQCINQAIQNAYPTLYMQDEEMQEKIHADMMRRHAERIVKYLDQAGESDIIPETYEELEERIRPPSPTMEDYKRLLAERLPTARMEPDRRFNNEEIQTIRESSAFDDEKTRRLEAQALGIADVVEEEEDGNRPRKRQKNMMSAQRRANAEDDEVEEEESGPSGGNSSD